MPVFQRGKKREYVGCFRRTPFLWLLAPVACAGLYFGLPLLFETSYRAPLSAAAVKVVAKEEAPPPVVHLLTPKQQKIIYMTSSGEYLLLMPSFWRP